MRGLFALLLGIISVLATQAQILDPVKWSFESKAISSDEVELRLTAKLDQGWHLYSQNLPSDNGPIPTQFSFEKNDAVRLIGKVLEPKAKTEYDPNFDMELSFFSNQVVFTQKVQVLDQTTLKGNVYYMVCDDKMCLPPEEVNFSFELRLGESNNENPDEESLNSDGSQEIEAVKAKSEGILEPVTWSFRLEALANDELLVIAEASMDEGWHLYSMNLPDGDGPVPTEFVIESTEGLSLIGKPEEIGDLKTEYDPNFMMDLSFFSNKVQLVQRVKPANADLIKGYVYFMTCDDERCLPPEEVRFELSTSSLLNKSVIKESGKKSIKVDRSLIGIFIAGFFGGLLALLTPCVFPMIPLTVSFFTKQSKSKAKGISNAMIYGVSIILIYVVLGYLTTVIFGADALNALSTNFWFNLAFFFMFVIFAISFFGAFEITLPSSWVNKADSAADKGGLIGIFFMAFTLSLVSFSCTGPIIGTLLVEAAVNGGVAGPLMGMFGFSFALALPFALFAAFPGWLNSLPQSGGWLNSVKVVLGFLELALALKFLSNADLVVQGGWLPRELFIAIWIGIFGMLGLYLLGAYRLPHDSPIDRISVGRMLFATVTIIFTIYLIPGLWGAPLKIISGFPPPMFYSESPNGVGASQISGSNGNAAHASKGHCPHNLNCFHDYEEALAYAKEVNKPIMLDFTGWACVNCRKMEEQVWSDPAVLSRLQNDVVLVSLYVDEKTALPEEEQKEVKIGEKTKLLETIGNKWSYFQASKFGTNSQPYYVMLDHEGNQLHESAAYDPDIALFIDWLDRGKKAFKNAK